MSTSISFRQADGALQALVQIEEMGLLYAVAALMELLRTEA
jgi:hypothetical protein